MLFALRLSLTQPGWLSLPDFLQPWSSEPAPGPAIRYSLPHAWGPGPLQLPHLLPGPLEHWEPSLSDRVLRALRDKRWETS